LLTRERAKIGLFHQEAEMKAPLIAAVLLLAASQVWAVMTVYDGFAYTADPAPQYLGGQVNPLLSSAWTKGSGATGTDAVMTAGSLRCTGLPAAIGNSVILSGDPAASSVVDRISPGGAGTFTSGTLYYSLVLKVADLTGASTSPGGFIAGFNNSPPDTTGGVTRAGARLFVRADPLDPGRFNLGIRNDTGTTSETVWDSTQFAPGPGSDPIFLVVAYEFNPAGSTDDVTRLWINPAPATFGQGTAPPTSLVHTGFDIYQSQIQSFFLRQVDTGPNVTIVDELRIGTTWADVTPPVSCSPPAVAAINPIRATQGQTLGGVVITGTNFAPGLGIKLTRAGRPDIAAGNVVVMDSTHVSCSLDLTSAAVGKWNVVVTSCESATLADGFEVRLDDVVVVNGRKFFVIGLSPGPPPDGVTPSGADALQELRDAGANMFRIPQTTDWDDQVIAQQTAALDAAAQHDMYCWVNLRELSSIAPGDTAKEAKLRDVMNRFKGHAAMGLWKNYDEAAWSGQSVDAMVRGYQIIKEEDPDRAVVLTHAPRLTVEELQPYNAAADILNLDIYPVSYPPGTHSLLANKEISMVGDWTQFLGQVANGEKPRWMTLQIAWSGVTKPGKTLRFPTFPEERFMTYQAIINGARGLMYYGGNVTAAMTAEDAQLGWNWTFWKKVLRPVVEEIGDKGPLAPALIAPDSGLPIQVTGASDVEFCVREAGNDLFILACKREGATVKVEFSGLPGWAGDGEVLFEAPRMVTAQSGKFTDWFGPFEVHVYHFRRSLTSDFDADADVDLTDFARFQQCFNGPNRPPAAAGCDAADADVDNDVDLADFAVFQACFNGPNRPPACSWSGPGADRIA
jgi:hypothetical protein